MSKDYKKCPKCLCPMPEPKEGTAFGGWHTEAEIGGWTCTVNQLAQRDEQIAALKSIVDKMHRVTLVICENLLREIAEAAASAKEES